MEGVRPARFLVGASRPFCRAILPKSQDMDRFGTSLGSLLALGAPKEGSETFLRLERKKTGEGPPLPSERYKLRRLSPKNRAALGRGITVNDHNQPTNWLNSDGGEILMDEWEWFIVVVRQQSALTGRGTGRRFNSLFFGLYCVPTGIISFCREKMP